jgi:hypothetical protein
MCNAVTVTIAANTHMPSQIGLIIPGYTLSLLHIGAVQARKLKVDLSFGAGEDSATAVLRVDWLPCSQTELAVACTQFVRIFDLAVDAVVPAHTLYLPGTSEEARSK